MDSAARADVTDLRNQARDTHKTWNVDQEIEVFRRELEADPMLYAKALLDIAGENYFHQERLVQDIGKKLADTTLPAEAKSVLEDALQRARSLQPTDKATKYFTGARPAALEYDCPGPVLEESRPEVREKRPRQPIGFVPEPKPIDRRILGAIPGVPSAGPRSGLVQNLDLRSGPSKEEQLNRILRMSPQDQAKYVYENINEMLALTDRSSEEPRGVPIFYDIRDGSKVICTLDRQDYRLVLTTVQNALIAIGSCKHHSKEGRCSCWLPYRNELDYQRNFRGGDHPVSIALAFYWDIVEQTAKDRPKKDATMDALQQLTTKVEAIAEQQTSLIDTQGAGWVGRKKGSRTLGGK